jgi:tyrosine-protein phosphatase SIW14
VLGIKTVIFLCPEEYPDAHLLFLESIGARLLQFPVSGNKLYPAMTISSRVVRQACAQVFSSAARQAPVLIHCNKGKHRTGCIVGCIRKHLGWSLTSIIDEYTRYARPKARLMDQQFIELFDPAGTGGTLDDFSFDDTKRAAAASKAAVKAAAKRRAARASAAVADAAARVLQAQPPPPVIVVIEEGAADAAVEVKTTELVAAAAAAADTAGIASSKTAAEAKTATAKAAATATEVTATAPDVTATAKASVKV